MNSPLVSQILDKKSLSSPRTTRGTERDRLGILLKIQPAFTTRITSPLILEAASHWESMRVSWKESGLYSYITVTSSRLHIQMLSQVISFSKSLSSVKLVLSIAAKEHPFHQFVLPMIGSQVWPLRTRRLATLVTHSREPVSFISAITSRKPTRAESGLIQEMEVSKVFISFQKTGLLIHNGQVTWSTHLDVPSCSLINGPPCPNHIGMIF